LAATVFPRGFGELVSLGIADVVKTVLVVCKDPELVVVSVSSDVEAKVVKVVTTTSTVDFKVGSVLVDSVIDTVLDGSTIEETVVANSVAVLKLSEEADSDNVARVERGAAVHLRAATILDASTKFQSII
jgi:hypothetical protein